MNGYAKAFFPPAPSYPIVDRLTDGPAVVDLRQMAPLRLFAAQTHQQAPRCPRSANGVRPFALPLASAPCSLISRPPAASSSSSVPHGSRLNFAVPALGSDHAIPLSLSPDHGRRSPPSPCFSQGAHRPLRPPFTASSGQLSRHLLRPLPSIILPAQSRCGSQIGQTGLLPFKPVRLLCAPLAAPPDTCRLRSALPLQFPATVSRSSLYNLPLACAPHAHHQTRGHVSFPQHSSATRDPRPATSHPRCSLSRRPRRVPLHPPRASTARPFTFLLISCLPLPLSLPIHHSHQSRSPRTLIVRIRHTAAADPSFHLSQHRRPARHALPSASSPM